MHIVLFSVSITILNSCSSKVGEEADYTVLEEMNLPEALVETSGLYCPEDNAAYTVNDSGNKPVIYKMNDKGQVVDQQLLAAKNIDWEALTGDGSHFYVGDVGNNSGKRKSVKVHILPKGESGTGLSSLNIVYLNNVLAENEYTQHDLDAEALVSMGDNLFLFSKSWNTGKLFIYTLSKTQTEQIVEPTSIIEGLPGLITGGDYDQQNERFVLVGYALKAAKRFYPFIAILNKEFALIKTFTLDNFEQVEGVCVTPNGEVWFTQERSFLSSPKLVKIKLMK